MRERGRAEEGGLRGRAEGEGEGGGLRRERGRAAGKFQAFRKEDCTSHKTLHIIKHTEVRNFNNCTEPFALPTRLNDRSRSPHSNVMIFLNASVTKVDGS